MLGGFLRGIHFYRKVPHDLTEATLTGGTISLASSLIMAYLFITKCELATRLSPAALPASSLPVDAEPPYSALTSQLQRVRERGHEDGHCARQEPRVEAADQFQCDAARAARAAASPISPMSWAPTSRT